jgi:hypothetical protein
MRTADNLTIFMCDCLEILLEPSEPVLTFNMTALPYNVFINYAVKLNLALLTINYVICVRFTDV